MISLLTIHELFNKEEYLTDHYSLDFYSQLAARCRVDVEILSLNLRKTWLENLVAIKKITAKLNKVKSTKEKVRKRVSAEEQAAVEKKELTNIINSGIYRKCTLASLAYFVLKRIVPTKEFLVMWPFLRGEKFESKINEWGRFWLGKKDFERRAYRGGITDVFNQQTLPKRTKVYAFDKTSMYPSYMKKKQLPVGYPKRMMKTFYHYDREKKKYRWVRKMTDSGTYKIEIDHLKLKRTYWNYPLLYLMDEDGIIKSFREIKHKLIYCKGVEWKALLKLYRGTWECYEGLEYTEVKNQYLGAYVSYFFNLKKRAERKKNGYLRLIAKLMLNSLYGRFGLKDLHRNYQWTVVAQPRSGEVKFDTSDQKCWQLTLSEPAPIKSWSYLPVATTITAYGRAELIRSVLLNRKELLYTDTDCLILKTPQLKLLKGQRIGSMLGAWKPEPVSSRWISNGDKCYTMKSEGKVVTKLKSIRTEYHSEYTFGVGQTWVRDDLYQPLEHGNVIKSTERTVPLPEENRKKRLVNGQWWPVEHLPAMDWTDQSDYWQKLKEGVI